MRSTALSIGEVASRAGVKVSTLHFYEEKGLISSSRSAGNQRRYKKDVLRRISIIKAAQKVGISLKSIKQAFSALPENRTPTQKDWEILAGQWNQELTQRIEYLERLRRSFSQCIGCGCLSLSQCPIYNQNDELAKQGSGAILLDKNLEKVSH